MRMAPSKPQGRKDCTFCGGTGWSRSSSGAACGCVAAPVARSAPAAHSLPPGTRACDHCAHPTTRPGLCAQCAHAREEQLRTDTAFNARVRGGARGSRWLDPIRLPSQENQVRAGGPPRRALTTTPEPLVAPVVHRDVKPANMAPARRAPVEHRRAVAAALRPTDFVESRVERDDDACSAAERAFSGHEGSQVGRRTRAA